MAGRPRGPSSSSDRHGLLDPVLGLVLVVLQDVVGGEANDREMDGNSKGRAQIDRLGLGLVVDIFKAGRVLVWLSLGLTVLAGLGTARVLIEVLFHQSAQSPTFAIPSVAIAGLATAMTIRIRALRHRQAAKRPSGSKQSASSSAAGKRGRARRRRDRSWDPA